jgi:imidazolonepropionase-like amidohydrolase
METSPLTSDSDDGRKGVFVLEGGLVDAHLHLAIDFADQRLPTAELIERNHETITRAGVLGARDIGAPPAAPSMTDLPRDRIQIASRILGPAGRSYPGICLDTEPDELVAAGRSLAASGADWVKVMWDFPGPDGDWLASPQNYDVGVVRALVDEVHALGGRVAVHSIGPTTHGAVLAGVDSVEHGGVLDRSTLEEMAARGTIWVPTLWTAHKHLDPLRSFGPELAAVVDRFFAAVETQLADAHELGVPVLAGSDETFPGELWREIESLAIHGLSNAEALAAASSVARTALRLPAIDGDRVVFACDPRADLTTLRAPLAVFARDVGDTRGAA